MPKKKSRREGGGEWKNAEKGERENRWSREREFYLSTVWMHNRSHMLSHKLKHRWFFLRIYNLKKNTKDCV